MFLVFSIPPIKNSSSYGDRPQRHHTVASPPSRCPEKKQLFKQPSHLDCLCLQWSRSRKLVATTSRTGFVSPPALPHTQLSTLPQQLTVVFHESHYPVIIDPSASRAPLSDINNEDSSDIYTILGKYCSLYMPFVFQESYHSVSIDSSGLQSLKPFI